MGCPAPATVCRCSACAIDREMFDEVGQRGLALTQIGGQRRPIVHLGVDVDGVIAAPRRSRIVVPYPLQVGRLGARLRRRNQQIATHVVEQRQQSDIIGRSLDRRMRICVAVIAHRRIEHRLLSSRQTTQSFVGRQITPSGFDDHGAAVIQRTVGSNMPTVCARAREVPQTLPCTMFGISGSWRVEGFEARRRADDNRAVRRIGYMYPVFVRAQNPVVRVDMCHGACAHPTAEAGKRGVCIDIIWFYM